MQLIEHNIETDTIDVLKGICIIFVITEHFVWNSVEPIKYLFPFWLKMEVPIFMILSGYVYALSYERHGISYMSEAYSIDNWIGKYLRYTAPYMIVMVIIEGVQRYQGTSSTILEYIKEMINGGPGDGGYYYSIMVQFLFVFPILYFVIKKYDKKGLWFCLFLNALYELVQWAYSFSAESYRLLLFRYIFIIAFGCFNAIGKAQIEKGIYAAMWIVGFGFLIAFNYLGYKPRIITYWTKTCFISCFYIVPIAAMLLKAKLHNKFLSEIGKASYHIFLIQMLIYVIAKRDGAIIIPIERKLQFFAILSVSLLIGYLYYRVEKPLNDKACKFIRKTIMKKGSKSCRDS